MDEARQSGVCRCRFGVRPGPRGEWDPDSDGCDWTGRASEAEAHEAGCVQKPVPCRWGCGLELLPREAAAHEAACADTVVRCCFAGCNVQHRRQDTNEHAKEAAELHARCERKVRLQLGSCDEFFPAAGAVITRAAAAKNIGLVVAVLGLCQRNEEVALRACAALADLSNDEGDAVKAGDAGAIEAVVAAMKAYPASADVQECACWALGNMADGAANNAVIKACAPAAIEAVMAAMTAHPGSEKLQKQARLALDILNADATGN